MIPSLFTPSPTEWWLDAGLVLPWAAKLERAGFVIPMQPHPYPYIARSVPSPWTHRVYPPDPRGQR